MSDDTTTAETRGENRISFADKVPLAAILVAHAPEGMISVDRCAVKASFSVGRSSECDLQVRDSKVSKHHFRITRREGRTWIEDLGSKNGTFTDGLLVETRQELKSPATIRVGRSLLQFHADAAEMLEPPSPNQFAMAGRFYTGPIIRELREASISSRHVLLSGPSGTGKELAARALAAMLETKTASVPFVAHNAAQFASEEEAATTLFGVGQKVFSEVAARAGLIEQASGGILFLDEVHNLPQRVQRGLLRVIEDGQLKRVGDSRVRVVRVRFILASNVNETSCGLASDLYNRLRLVSIPPLSERAADVPSIFNAVLNDALIHHNLKESALLSLLTADHYEALMLDGFKSDNVRGLVDLADRMVTRVASGVTPPDALASVFFERFGDSLVAKRQSYPPTKEVKQGVSHYELNKSAIVSAYHECSGNISAVVRLLHSRGIQCSRRWLTIFLERWGLKT